MTIKAAVIGHPIAHSKSPLIHGYWIEKYGLDGFYEAIDIPCEALEVRVRDLAAQGYVGFNVTVPHKEAIFEICDEVDDVARAVGAVNTVTLAHGKLYGTNTDGFGFIQNIVQHKNDYDFAADKVVVLGAGGAARAVLQGLLQKGCKDIILLNRTIKRAEKLADDFDFVQVEAWEKRNKILNGASLLVNTTALGMSGQPALEIDLGALPQEALVTDIVYAPLMTDLLTAAQNRGNPIVTGIGMLLHQARPAFEAWFGVMPEVDEALERLALA